jgi:hypothetical protein
MLTDTFALPICTVHVLVPWFFIGVFVKKSSRTVAAAIYLQEYVIFS